MKYFCAVTPGSSRIGMSVFSRWFSSSSCLSHFISNGISPPYCLQEVEKEASLIPALRRSFFGLPQHKRDPLLAEPRFLHQTFSARPGH
jgi:hypothetical protein